MNSYPLWKNLLVLGVLVAATILALPNLFGDDPAVQVTRSDGQPVAEATVEKIKSSLSDAGIGFNSVETSDTAALIRFPNVDQQLRANDSLRQTLPDHVIALTLAARTPPWLGVLGLKPMALGLDLRGGVHFLYQVDVDSAIQQFLETYQSQLRRSLREANIRNSIDVQGNALLVTLRDSADMDEAARQINQLEDTGQISQLGQQRLIVTRTTIGGMPGFRVQMSDALIKERQDFAIEQNTTTLRNRINELGVSEPVVQRQGLDRILIELPGVQDPSQAERILGATATLEFHMVDTENSAYDAANRGRAPIGSALYQCADSVTSSCAQTDQGRVILLHREVIVSGDQLTDATSGYSQGQPAVFVNLNAQGARRMLDTTQANLGRPMAVLFIEETPQVVERNGEQTIETSTKESVINVATIQGVFSNRFQITGLTPFEARDLALLLRAGSLAAPIVKVEERTIGPSLGQDNIAKGRLAVIVGFLVVVAFMAVYYRVFGLVADLALFANLVLIVALLSLLQAALTLPGIAGIVLTVGMAVDANVLIFERIREELRNGNSPQSSIRAGYEKAFSTIADANITTLIAAIVLFTFGTGPIKGFAVTLSIGIVTSMFTAIMGTRAVVNFIYGGRRQVRQLAIGGSVS
jgi:preprotein translocase subunit SecD